MVRGLTAASTALVLAACSSSGGAKHAGTSNGSASEASTKAAITAAYTTFFNSTTTLAQSVASLQHGAAFRTTLEAEAKSSYAQKSSATVAAITLISPSVADVSFTIHSTISLPSKGKAVREDGTWKVAAQTFCDLLTLERTAPAACKDPAVVGLPS